MSGEKPRQYTTGTFRNSENLLYCTRLRDAPIFPRPPYNDPVFVIYRFKRLMVKT